MGRREGRAKQHKISDIDELGQSPKHKKCEL